MRSSPPKGAGPVHLSVHLPATGSSAQWARQLVSRTLAQGGYYDPQLVDRLVLVTSELVTNAILHARTEVGLDVNVDESSIVLEVTDSSPATIPPPRVPDPEDTSGRGLFLVDVLSDAWGVRSLDGGGKTVWIRVQAVS